MYDESMRVELNIFLKDISEPTSFLYYLCAEDDV